MESPQSSSNVVIKKDKLSVLKWITSISLFIYGLNTLTEYVFSAIIIICVSLFICPYIYNYIFVDVLKKTFNSKTKWWVVILSLVFHVVVISNEITTKKEKNEQKIVQKINTLIDSNKIQDAISIINDYKKDNGIENIDTSNVVCKIQIEIFDSQDYNYMCKKMVSLNDDDIKLLKLNKLNKQWFKQKTLNKNFSEFLFKNSKNYKSIKNKIDKQNEKEARDLLLDVIKTNIKSHFYGYSGEHKILSQYLKNNLNNPDSYEHVSTWYEYNDGDSYYTIYTKIRGTNGFGAIITTSFKAKASLDGEIISVK